MRELAANLRADGIGILHCHCYKSLDYAVLMRFLEKYTSRIVYTLHGLVAGDGFLASVIRRGQAYCQHRVDGVIGCFREILESVTSLPRRVAGAAIANAVGIPAGSHETLERNRPDARNCLSERYGLAPGGGIILNVGRLCPQKNFSLYFQLIYRNVTERGADENLYFLGGMASGEANTKPWSQIGESVTMSSSPGLWPT